MNQHIHHVEIKAWADGAEIEYFDPWSETWMPASTPSWNTKIKYRVKPQPEVVRYKRYLHRNAAGPRMGAHMGTHNEGDDNPETWSGFIRWIDTDWQEEVV